MQSELNHFHTLRNSSNEPKIGVFQAIQVQLLRLQCLEIALPNTPLSKHMLWLEELPSPSDNVTPTGDTSGMTAQQDTPPSPPPPRVAQRPPFPLLIRV